MDRTERKDGKESKRSAAHEMGSRFSFLPHGDRQSYRCESPYTVAKGRRKGEKGGEEEKQEKKEQEEEEEEDEDEDGSDRARCIDAPRHAEGREERRVEGPRDGRTRRWMNEKKKSHPPWRPEAMGERRPVAKGRRIGGGDSATFEVLLRSPGSPTCCAARRFCRSLSSSLNERFDVSARR